MSKRRKKRQSLEGSKWRVMGPIEKSILTKLDAAMVDLTVEANALTPQSEKFIGFLASMRHAPSISVRQKWYLGLVASKNVSLVSFDERETEWINDVLSQECPEGFTKPTPYWEKATQPLPAILIGSRRKIRE